MSDREWRPPRLLKPFVRMAPWGYPRQVLMILADSDKTFTQVREGFDRFMYHFGYFGREEKVAGFTEETHLTLIREAIAKLERERALVQRDGIYSLTHSGRLRAEKMQIEFQTFGRWIENFLHPQMVALVGLSVHIVLAGLKLIAGAISGSMGLISDGMDTAMDGLSSVLLFFGLRLKKERIVNIVLVILMLAVGIGTGYGALKRAFYPEEVEADVLTFVAAILSGTICILLSLYQRYVATRSGQQALIAQAVDSRNHAIVAAGVVTGLVATLLHFPLLDTLVGLVVAILIFKSGFELGLETLRSLRGEEVDFSRYELSFIEEYRRFQQRQLADWLLHLIITEGPLTRQKLLARCQELLNIQDVPTLRELGWGKASKLERKVTDALENLFEMRLVTASDVLSVTEEGHAKPQIYSVR